MRYDINGNDVFLDEQKIGTKQANLLVLEKNVSDTEWSMVENHIKINRIYNGKIFRKKFGFHHSYEVKGGIPYRLDHSLISKVTKGDSIDYEDRGYLGSGSFGTVKSMYRQESELASTEPLALVTKVEKYTVDNFDKAKRYGYSNEAVINKKLGTLMQEYLRWLEKPFSFQHKEYVAKKVLVMEKIPGVTGFNILKAQHEASSNDQKLTIRDRLHFAIIMARTFAKIYNLGILHRDIKLDNFVLDLKKLTGKACDFQFAKKLPKGQKEILTDDGMGTKGYVAPEIYAGCLSGVSTVYSEKSEIYSLGMSFAHLFSGFGFFEKYIVENMICGFEGALMFEKQAEKKKELDRVQAQLSNNTTHTWLRISLETAVQNYQVELKDVETKLKIEAEKRALRTSFEEVINFFTECLKKYNLTEINQTLEKVQVEKDDFKAALLLKLASLYHLTDYAQAIEYSKQAYHAAISIEQKHLAWKSVVDYYERHVDMILLQPEYGLAIAKLFECAQFIEDYNLAEHDFARQAKKRIELQIQGLINQSKLKEAKEMLLPNVLTEQTKMHAASMILSVADSVSSLEEKNKLYQKALKLIPEGETKLVLMNKIKNAYKEMANLYAADNDTLAAQFCISEIQKLPLTNDEIVQLKNMLSVNENEAIKITRATLLRFSKRPDNVSNKNKSNDDDKVESRPGFAP